VDCEFRAISPNDVDALIDDINNGLRDEQDALESQIPTIRGLPTKDGESAHAFIRRFQYGLQIRSAILDTYYPYMRKGRVGNSVKRR
jgi:hypothetical protein